MRFNSLFVLFLSACGGNSVRYVEVTGDGGVVVQPCSSDTQCGPDATCGDDGFCVRVEEWVVEHGCADDAGCDDGDANTSDVCVGGACHHTSRSAAESCNGVDDDGDGAVDEGLWRLSEHVLVAVSRPNASIYLGDMVWSGSEYGVLTITRDEDRHIVDEDGSERWVQGEQRIDLLVMGRDAGEPVSHRLHTVGEGFFGGAGVDDLLHADGKFVALFSVQDQPDLTYTEYMNVVDSGSGETIWQQHDLTGFPGAPHQRAVWNGSEYVRFSLHNLDGLGWNTLAHVFGPEGDYRGEFELDVNGYFDVIKTDEGYLVSWMERSEEWGQYPINIRVRSLTDGFRENGHEVVASLTGYEPLFRGSLRRLVSLGDRVLVPWVRPAWPLVEVLVAANNGTLIQDFTAWPMIPVAANERAVLGTHDGSTLHIMRVDGSIEASARLARLSVQHLVAADATGFGATYLLSRENEDGTTYDNVYFVRYACD